MSQLSRTPGIGHITPPPGTPVRWRWYGPGGGPAPSSLFNPAAGDPFGTGINGALNIVKYRLRYGVDSPSGRPVRPSDGAIADYEGAGAEAAIVQLPRALMILFERGELHTRWPQHFRNPSTVPGGLSGSPTDLESNDIIATLSPDPRDIMNAAGIGSGAPGGANNQPGVPVIESVTALDHDTAIRVRFRAALNGHTQYQIAVWGSENPSHTEQFDAFTTIEGEKEDLPGSRFWTADVSISGRVDPGLAAVAVRAYIGGTVGRWSGMKTIKVEPRSAPSTPPTTTPPTPPTVPTTPTTPAVPQPPSATPTEPLPPTPPVTLYRVFAVRVPSTPNSTSSPEIKEIEANKWSAL